MCLETNNFYNTIIVDIFYKQLILLRTFKYFENLK